MGQMPRRDFMSASLAATLGASGAIAATELSGDPLPSNIEPDNNDLITVVKHDHDPVKNEGVDIVVRLSGRLDKDIKTLQGALAKIKEVGQDSWGTSIIEHGPHRLVVRVTPATDKEKTAGSDCFPCHMVLCYCGCFEAGGVGGNCSNCAHSATDHY